MDGICYTDFQSCKTFIVMTLKDHSIVALNEESVEKKELYNKIQKEL